MPSSAERDLARATSGSKYFSASTKRPPSKARSPRTRRASAFVGSRSRAVFALSSARTGSWRPSCCTRASSAWRRALPIRLSTTASSFSMRVTTLASSPRDAYARRRATDAAPSEGSSSRASLYRSMAPSTSPRPWRRRAARFHCSARAAGVAAWVASASMADSAAAASPACSRSFATASRAVAFVGWSSRTRS